MKICSKCKIAREATGEFFAPDNRKKNGLQARCRKCKKIEAAKHYSLNHDKVLTDAAMYRAENREKIKVYFRIYNSSAQRQEYLKEHRQKHLKHYKEAHSEWRKNNKEKSNTRIRAYKKRMAIATPPWLTKTQRTEINRFYAEARELSWLSDGGLSVDHYIPLKGKNVSGLNVPWNLRIIPLSDNCSKGYRLIE